MSERVDYLPGQDRDSVSAWIPLVLGTGLALAWNPGLPRWGEMWLLAVVIFAGFKWLTFCRAMEARVRTTAARALTYLCLWPGMDARTFLDIPTRGTSPARREWIAAIGKTCFGAALIWGVARLAGEDLLAGWIGMAGAIFLLHCGCFHMLANFWRARGISAQPLMRMPIASGSVSEFWGRRWNVAFQGIAFETFFQPMRRRFGAGWAVMGTFFVSGIIHDLVITVPTGAGYGLPTVYFSLQGAAMIAEHGNRHWFRAHPAMNRLFAWLVVAGPAGLLFPPVFVERVMLPFLKVIGAL